MKKKGKIIIALACAFALFLLPFALAEGGAKITINDAENLSLDRPAVIFASITPPKGAEGPFSIKLEAKEGCAQFHGDSAVTIKATKQDDGSYEVKGIATLKKTSGTFVMTSSTGETKEIQYKAKEKADDGKPVLSNQDKSENKTPVSDQKDDQNQKDSQDKNDSPVKTDPEPSEENTLTIYAGTDNQAISIDKNTGFSAVLTDKDGKKVQLSGSETYTWSVKLDGEAMDYKNASSKAITVKPQKTGKLQVDCSLQDGTKLYQSKPLMISVVDQEVPLESVKIVVPSDEVKAGDSVSVQAQLNPENCTGLEGADVQWQAYQDGALIAESDKLSGFVVKPETDKDITIQLKITPKGAGKAVEAEPATVKVKADPSASTVLLKSVTLKAGQDLKAAKVGDKLTFTAVLNPADMSRSGLIFNWLVQDKATGKTLAQGTEETFTYQPKSAGEAIVSLNVMQGDRSVEAQEITLSVQEKTEQKADQVQSKKPAQAQNVKEPSAEQSDQNKPAATEQKPDETQNQAVNSTVAAQVEKLSSPDPFTSNASEKTKGKVTVEKPAPTVTSQVSEDETDKAKAEAYATKNATSPETGTAGQNKEIYLTLAVAGAALILMIVVSKKKNRQTDFFL